MVDGIEIGKWCIKMKGEGMGINKYVNILFNFFGGKYFFCILFGFFCFCF